MTCSVDAQAQIEKLSAEYLREILHETEEENTNQESIYELYVSLRSNDKLTDQSNATNKRYRHQSDRICQIKILFNDQVTKITGFSRPDVYISEFIATSALVEFPSFNHIDSYRANQINYNNAFDNNFRIAPEFRDYQPFVTIQNEDSALKYWQSNPGPMTNRNYPIVAIIPQSNILNSNQPVECILAKLLCTPEVLTELTCDICRERTFNFKKPAINADLLIYTEEVKPENKLKTPATIFLDMNQKLVTRYIEQQRDLIIQYDISLAQNKDSVNFPISASIHITSKDILIYAIEAVVNQITPRNDLTATDFNETFPGGTYLVDYIAHEHAVLQSDGTRKLIDQALLHVPQVSYESLLNNTHDINTFHDQLDSRYNKQRLLLNSLLTYPLNLLVTTIVFFILMVLFRFQIPYRFFRKKLNRQYYADSIMQE